MKSYSKEEIVIAAGAHIEERQYWLNKLSDNLFNTILMTKDTMPGTEYGNGIYEFQLSEEDSKRIVEFGRDNDYVIHMAFTAALTLMIYKYTGLTDILIDTPIYKQKEDGAFINTVLTLRNRFKEEESLKELLLDVRKIISEAVKHQNFPISFLADKLGSDGTKINYPFTDAAIIYENIQDISYLRENRYSFTLSLLRDTLGIGGKIHYNSACYTPDEIKTMSMHFCKVLHELLVDLNTSVKDVNMMDEAEKNKILYEFNNTKAEYPDSKTLHGLFKEQVKRQPDAVAAVFGEESIAYEELDRKSEALAYELRQKGVSRDSIVGIIVKRSLEMIVGILGILKAGGAYLPIDPDMPAERLKYIVEDSGMKLAITQTGYYDCCDMVPEVIDLEDKSIYGKKAELPEPVNQPRDLAYVIYTSGSTGNPKGVMIEHTSVINRINWMQKRYALKESDVILQKTPFTFDVSVWEMFWWMLAGAKVCFLIPEGEKNPAEIIKAIEKNKVTVMHFVPSMLNGFLEYMKTNNEAHRLTSLEKVFASGEALTAEHVKKFNKILNKKNHTKLYNLYGPTEAAVDVTYFDCPQEGEIGTIPIGKPIDNIRIYILDKEGRPQPKGISGEICIAGVGVGRGYLNKPELTKEKFAEDPFVSGERMYKTGDLGRWMEDGNIEYLGRNDFQVKIRGFRIELGEIEKQLLKCEPVKEAVALVKTDKNGEKYICAYITGSEPIAVNELKAELSKVLPEYMIPSFIMQPDEIPLTSNGKVNRKELLSIEEKHQQETEYAEPESELEKQLAAVWCEVLDVDRVGVNDDFFEIGGQSLKAVNMTVKIYSKTGIKMNLEDVFKYRTIRNIVDNLKNIEIGQINRIKRGERREAYPLSAAQKRLYIQSEMEDNLVYNISYFMEVEGQFDIDKANAAINKLVNRHESLRTAFEHDGKNVVQKVYSDVAVKVEVHEENIKEDADPSTYEEGLKEVVRKYIKPFQLNIAPLCRMQLLKVNEKKCYIIFDIHHIIADGISVAIIMKEFSALYNGEELPEVKLQYSDYVMWQQESAETDYIKKKEEYWMNKFYNSEKVPVLSFPLDYTKPTRQTFEGDDYYFTLGKELSERIKEITSQTGTTLYMFLLAAYHVMLSKYSGQDDIVIGTPVAGRTDDDLQNVVGMFINIVPMRNKSNQDMTFSDFLGMVKENVIQAFENQDYQLDMLVEKLTNEKKLDTNQLYQTMFILQNYDINKKDIQDVQLKGSEFSNRISKIDFSLYTKESADCIECCLVYCTRMLKAETAQRIAEHYIAVLENICDDIHEKLQNITMMSAAEKEQILSVFNDTKAEYPSSKTLHGLFEEQAAKIPDSIALVYEGKQLSYRELNEKANRLARVLRAKGVGPDSIVGLMAERCLEMEIGILAILKAGGAYLPISPDYPADRIKYMLEDSGAGILLTQGIFIDKVDFDSKINLEDSSIYQGDITNPEYISTPRDLAYIIYTSGSTGKPKGVMIEHRSVINRINWMQKKYPLDASDVILQKTTFTFDVSVWELFWWFFAGTRVCFLAPGGEKDPEAIASAIEKNKVTTMHFVPSMLNVFLDYIDGKIAAKRLSGLRQVFASGEALSPRQAQDFKRILGSTNGTKLINLYGPTEATVDVSCFDCSEAENLDTIPIGKPIDNIELFVMDKYNNLMPIGVPGELCIAGVGLARGYINRPELTAEKFTANLFAHSPSEAGDRMYRTGDLVKWLPDGNIEFLGRIDHQVKIRGYRIELGEIENKLLSYEPVKEAVVMTREDNSGSKYLCAYIAGEKELTVSELREHLSKDLPDYMLPSYFVQLEKLPLTHNGKVDRKALPEPDGNISTGAEYEAPRNSIEETLLAIWEEVLGIDDIGLNDDFFELGGHSLKATSLITKIHKALNVEIPLKEVVRASTIKEMAEYIESRAKSAVTVNKGNRVFLLREGTDSAKNIFFIHDGSGDISGYLELCDKLDRSLNCWGIKAGSEGRLAPYNTTIEKLAKSYIDDIKAIQPYGPYLLGGWSLGGTIAYETARQLEGDREEVKALLLIDAYPPESKARVSWPQIIPEGEKTLTATLISNRKVREEIIAADGIEKVWETVAKYIEESGLEFERIKSMLPKSIGMLISEQECKDTKAFIGRLNIIRTLLSAKDQYTAKERIRAAVYLVRASESTGLNAETWNLISEMPVKASEIEGNHFSIMKGERAEKLAAILNKYL